MAIDGGWFAAELDDFDTVLLGSEVDYADFDLSIVGQGFVAHSGEMTQDRESPWAGVLAFVEPTVYSAGDPVLYLSPWFTGYLPRTVVRGVRRRVLAVAKRGW